MYDRGIGRLERDFFLMHCSECNNPCDTEIRGKKFKESFFYKYKPRNLKIIRKILTKAL